MFELVLNIPRFFKTWFFVGLLIGSKLNAVTYTAIGCPGPVTWSGFSAAGSPFWNGGTQLTSQPAAGSILVIPVGCTVSLDGNITANNTVTLEIYGQLFFADNGDKLDLSSSSSKINIYSGGSISGASNSNQIKIGSGGAEWSGPGTSAGPFVITNGSSTLPIELIEFFGTCETNGVKLNWSTATELNNDYFSIERSINGFDWLSIAKMEGGGTRKTLKHYTFTDHILNETKIYYYRLKQVDFDKSSSTSKLISVSCQQSFEIESTIFPNPASNEFNVQLNLKQEVAEVWLSVNNPIGEIVLERELKLVNGVNTFSFPISFESGIYTIVFSGENFIVPSQKLIILKP